MKDSEEILIKGIDYLINPEYAFFIRWDTKDSEIEILLLKWQYIANLFPEMSDQSIIDYWLWW